MLDPPAAPGTMARSLAALKGLATGHRSIVVGLSPGDGGESLVGTKLEVWTIQVESQDEIAVAQPG